MSESSKVNPYQYNGKEYNADHNLKLSDYGARWYDAAIGRWSSPDPLAEKYQGWSPYNYVMNNPLKFIDPNGMEVDEMAANYARRNNKKSISQSSLKDSEFGSEIGDKTKESNEEKKNGGDPIEKVTDNIVSNESVMQSNISQDDDSNSSSRIVDCDCGCPGKPPCTNDEELAKYGKIVSAINLTGTLSLGFGVTYEFGYVVTDKNYLQYYKTIYYTSTASFGVGANLIYIKSKDWANSTFSDWAGEVVGGSGTYGNYSISIARSHTYNALGGGLGAGLSFKKMGSYSAGYTFLIGSPIHLVPKRNEFSSNFLKSFGQH